jgi:predicted nucleic acid-binding Zn ribbon protein
LPADPSGRRAARSGEPEPLGSVIERMAQGRPWSAGLALGELARRWPEVVGERLARECTPGALEGGVLLVRASSAAWAGQIRFLAGDVRDRANQVLGRGLVQAVKVLLGGADEESERSPKRGLGPRG